MGRHDIPDRWMDYTPIGNIIEGTRFIAFKVPLRQHVSESVDAKIRLDIKTLLNDIPKLGLIIDLTNTNKYYDPVNFEKNGIKHVKIMVPGHAVPDLKYRNVFKATVKEFLENNHDNDKLIGVHCTHGVNRTGFLICNYMAREMNIKPKDAMERFAKCRGHPIERENYKEFIGANVDINCRLKRGCTDRYDEDDHILKKPMNEVPFMKNNSSYNNEFWKQNYTDNFHHSKKIENWRERIPPPPGIDPLEIRDYRFERDYKPIEHNSSSHSWRQTIHLNSTLNNNWRQRASEPYNSEQRNVYRNFDNLSRQSSYPKERYRNEDRSFQRNSYYNNSNASSTDQYTSRREKYPAYLRVAHRPSNTSTLTRQSHYTTGNHSRSSSYYNTNEKRDDNSQFNSRKRDNTQRTSTLDDLY